MSARDLWDEPGEPDRSKVRLHAVVAVVIPDPAEGVALFVRESSTGMIEMPAGWVAGLSSARLPAETDRACLRRLLAREAGQRLMRVAAYLGAEAYPDDVETRFYLCEVEPDLPLVAGGGARDAFWGDVSCASVSNYPWSGVMLRRGLAVARGFAPPLAPRGAIRRAVQAARRAAFRRDEVAYAPTLRPPVASLGDPKLYEVYEAARRSLRALRVPEDLAMAVEADAAAGAPKDAASTTVETKRVAPARRRAWALLSAVSALLAVETNEGKEDSDE